MFSLIRRGYLCKKALQIKNIKNYVAAAAGSTEKLPISYEKVILKRQSEASCSIVVQVNSEKSFSELCNYCNEFGNITNAYHYTVQYDDVQHYILLEFSNTEEANAAIDSSAYNDELNGVPVRSPFLWFKAANKATLKANTKNNTVARTLNLNTINGTKILRNQDVINILQKASSVDDQIHLLHRHTRLNDLGVRLRFLAALQAQQALTGMFPKASAQPFGSSVNGFGKMDCDLDLILCLDPNVTSGKIKRMSESRLVFHTKENLTNGRTQTQRQMESLGDMLHLFLPGVCHVRRILQARVPIIKYHHEHLNLEVDLSMTNLSGFYMSELLYMFGEYDERVRPLVFGIRRWASACGLTNPVPGRWITNFSLTCLVIYFLQQMKQPILPTINALAKAATPNDIRTTDDGINCTFARDFQKFAFRSDNPNTISELLLQFFEFYSQFDFQNRAISLNEGHSLAKPDHSALYIVNPLERNLNVSKNVSLEECERLRIEVRNAAWALESEVENLPIPENEKIDTSWGILNLFKTPEKSIVRPHMLFKPRMVEVKTLFEKNENPEVTKNETNVAVVSKPTPVTSFKSQAVKTQVQQVKSQARAELKQIHMNLSASGKSRSRRTR